MALPRQDLDWWRVGTPLRPAFLAAARAHAGPGLADYVASFADRGSGLWRAPGFRLRGQQ